MQKNCKYSKLKSSNNKAMFQAYAWLMLNTMQQQLSRWCCTISDLMYAYFAEYGPYNVCY